MSDDSPPPVQPSTSVTTTTHDAQVHGSLQCARSVPTPVGTAVNSVLHSLHHVTDLVLSTATGASSSLVTTCVEGGRVLEQRPTQQISSLLRETHGAKPLAQLYFQAVVEAIPRGLLTSRVSPHKNFSVVVQIGALETSTHEAYLLRVRDGRLVGVNIVTQHDVIRAAEVLLQYSEEAAFEEVLDGRMSAARAVAIGERAQLSNFARPPLLYSAAYTLR